MGYFKEEMLDVKFVWRSSYSSERWFNFMETNSWCLNDDLMCLFKYGFYSATVVNNSVIIDKFYMFEFLFEGL